MSFWISLINNASVSFFGSILSVSFCDALNSRKKRCIFVCGIMLLPLLQGFVYFSRGAEFMRQIYPLVVHLPLLLLLYALTGRLLWPLFSILTAYLCCQLRRWIALLAVAMLSGGETMHDSIELIVTLPLLLFLLRYASPVVHQLSYYPAKMQCQFGSIPAVYYVFDYITMVYTDLLSSGNSVAVEFIPFVCCAAYLVFLLYNYVRERTQSQLEQAQKSLGIQLNQAVREIDALRESQMLASQYRHDMRHHLQYVSACIQNGQEDQALSYITGICQEIDAQKVERYCENEAANLILSAFAGRAKKEGIPVSHEPGHGIGVQSICAIVERYDGMCSFLMQDDHFILRLSL